MGIDLEFDVHQLWQVIGDFYHDEWAVWSMRPWLCVPLIGYLAIIAESVTSSFESNTAIRA